MPGRRSCSPCDYTKSMARFEGDRLAIEYAGLRKTVDGMSGWRCDACGEVVFDPDSAGLYAAAGDELVLKSRKKEAGADREGAMKADEFETELRAQIARAQKQDRPHVEVNAGELHRVVGGYPNASSHRMPMCCDAMRREMTDGDEIVCEPAGGKGASLTIRYGLPRR